MWKVRVFHYNPGDYIIFVGPWVARFIYNLKPTTGFTHIAGQNRLIIFVRRFWSGWHLWDNGKDDWDDGEL